MNVAPAAEAEAESFGFLARQVNDQRASNPYLVYLQHESPTTQALADAWYRGWDRAEANQKKKAIKSTPTELLPRHPVERLAEGEASRSGAAGAVQKQGDRLRADWLPPSCLRPLIASV